MAKHALVVGGSVREIIDDGGGDISTMFHADIVAQLVACDGSVSQNDTYDGSNFAAYIPYVVTYKDTRRAAYASIGDQLDMQYHDLVDGTTTWKDHVAKVKSDNAKP
jgi:hypothetical protein|tara:strand:+ start:35192 stop:35512 length:321 start_codon:yes stop_codon:yes gene_type:complete